jgi:hypothetical protein
MVVTDTGLREHLLRQQEEPDAPNKTQFEPYGETMDQRSYYMGTAAVVRDMDFITTVLAGRDALMYVLSEASRPKSIPHPSATLRWIIRLDPRPVPCKHVRPFGLMRGVISNCRLCFQLSKPHRKDSD